MTPQSLRIGNYVKLRDTGEIVRVCGVNRYSVYFKKFSENDTYRDYSQIEGVLIYDHWQKIDCRSLIHSGYDDEIGKYNYYHSFYPKRVFRFIHELQNIHHALTGEEIEIEL